MPHEAALEITYSLSLSLSLCLLISSLFDADKLATHYLQRQSYEVIYISTNQQIDDCKLSHFIDLFDEK